MIFSHSTHTHRPFVLCFQARASKHVHAIWRDQWRQGIGLTYSVVVAVSALSRFGVHCFPCAVCSAGPWQRALCHHSRRPLIPRLQRTVFLRLPSRFHITALPLPCAAANCHPSHLSSVLVCFPWSPSCLCRRPSILLLLLLLLLLLFLVFLVPVQCKKLNLVFVGHVGSDISAVACAGQLTFAATGSKIVAKKRDVTVSDC